MTAHTQYHDHDSLTEDWLPGLGQMALGAAAVIVLIMLSAAYVW